LVRDAAFFFSFSYSFFFSSFHSTLSRFFSLFLDALTEAEEELIAISEDFKRDCHPDGQSTEEFFQNLMTGLDSVVTTLCANNKTVQLSFIHQVERALDLMNRSTEVLKETMNDKLGKRQADLIEEKTTLSEQILSKLIDSLKSVHSLFFSFLRLSFFFLIIFLFVFSACHQCAG